MLNFSKQDNRAEGGMDSNREEGTGRVGHLTWLTVSHSFEREALRRLRVRDVHRRR